MSVFAPTALTLCSHCEKERENAHFYTTFRAATLIIHQTRKLYDIWTSCTPLLGCASAFYVCVYLERGQHNAKIKQKCQTSTFCLGIFLTFCVIYELTWNFKAWLNVYCVPCKIFVVASRRTQKTWNVSKNRKIKTKQLGHKEFMAWATREK